MNSKTKIQSFLLTKRIINIIIKRIYSFGKCEKISPNFIVIGAQKAGTSSLFYYLSQHPQIKPSIVKEIHFFDGGLNPRVDNFKKGLNWYKSHFPYNSGKFITGEASPTYIYNPLVPQRIYNYFPDVKIIALLRNPVERAISHYFHEVRKGREEFPILKAFKEEEVRLNSILNNGDYKNTNLINKSYKMRGRYSEQLERYLKYFKNNNIIVHSSEEFFNNPQFVLSRIFKFLKIETNLQRIDLKPKNVGHYYEKVPNEVYSYLNAYFAKHNQNLFNLLNQDFGW